MDIIEIKEASDSELQKIFSSIGAAGGELNNRSIMQHFGFASIPKDADGVTGLVLKSGNYYVLIAEEPKKENRPALDNGETTLYKDEIRHIILKADDSINVITEKGLIKVEDDGNIEISNENNGVTLKANGDIELGEGTKEAIVKAAALTAIAPHTHPVSGVTALASTDPAMVALTTDPGNVTQKVKAE